MAVIPNLCILGPQADLPQITVGTITSLLLLIVVASRPPVEMLSDTEIS